MELGCLLTCFFADVICRLLWKHLKIMRYQWELWGNERTDWPCCRNQHWDASLVGKDGKKNVSVRSDKLRRETSTINHRKLSLGMHGMQDTTYINPYFNNNNHNSLIKFVEVLLVKCTLLNTFMYFICVLTATYVIGSKIIPIWQIVKWMYRASNLSKVQ